MASVRSRGGKFMALFRDADGKQKSAGTYDTKREARKAAQHAEATGFAPPKAERVYPGKVRGKATVASYAENWLGSHPVAAHTRYVYEQILRVHVLPEFGSKALTDITPADIRRYFRRLEADKTSAALGKKIRTVLSSLMRTAVEDDLIPFNPVRDARFQAATPARRRALTVGEWRRVRRYLTGEYRLLCDIVMATGARIEEVMGMEVRDISGATWTISRTRTEVAGQFAWKDSTKTGKSRKVMLPADLVERIFDRGPGRVFSDFKLNSFRMLHWYPACKAAELDWKPAPRDLRRSFATVARANGVDLEGVRMALGHTRLATTDIYLGERDDARTDAFLAVQRAMAV